ncbi:hypothetical protein Tco_1182651 [Tanacetum coccineum]
MGRARSGSDNGLTSSELEARVCIQGFVHYRGRAHGMPKNIAYCFELGGTPIIDVWLSIQWTLSHVTSLSQMAFSWDRSIAGQVSVGPHIAFSRS